MNRFLSTLAGLSVKARRPATVDPHAGRPSDDQDAVGADRRVPVGRHTLFLPSAAPALPVQHLDYDGFRWSSADKVSNRVRTSLEQQFEDLPRPPRAFHELLSLDFVARASSSYLADLVAGEPIVAARILARVNSSLYGTRAPIEQLGQAITFLGLHSVRNICLRYLLNESFKSANPAVRKMLSKISEASSVASDLAQRFAKRMVLEEPASLTTQLVLSFTGHLACALIETPPSDLDKASSLLQRFEQQQASIGLAAPEVGRLLLMSWRLPQQLIDNVAEIDRTLLPLQGSPTPRSQSAAVGFLCARLGQQLASEALNKPGDLEAWLENDEDLRFLSSHFDPPSYAEAMQAVLAPDFLEGIRAVAKPQD